MNCLLFYPHELTGDRLILENDDRRYRHCRDELKCRGGDALSCGCFGGRMGRAVVRTVNGRCIECDVSLDRDPPPPLSVILIVALPRPKSLRKVIHAAVTTGVKRVYIIESWRVEKSYWSSPVLHESSIAELVRIGLEQAGDTLVPCIETRRRFKPFVEDEVPSLVSDSEAFVLAPAAADRFPKRAPGCSCVLAVGPERGFTGYEIGMFERSGGFRPVNLGARQLRVEEAVCAALGRFL